MSRRETLRARGRAKYHGKPSKGFPQNTAGFVDPPILDCILIEDVALEKGATHKYLKREPRANPPPKYRYYYRIPGKGIVASDDHLAAGTKIKGKHAGQEGHYEVVHHDKAAGVIHVKHDESGKTARFKEKDLHRMVSSYHKKRGTPQPKKRKAKGPLPKPPPIKLRPQDTQTELKTPRTSREKPPKAAKPAEPEPPPKAEPKKPAEPLPSISMGDLASGGWDEVIGFAATAEAAAQLAATRDGHEHAVVKQPGGFVVASRKEIPRTGTKDATEATGQSTKVFMRDAAGKGVTELESEYVVMEADKLVASHDPLTMQPRKDYPKDVQERRYHEMTGEQMKVDRIARDMRPEIVVNSNPDGVNGAPVITEDNVVLGGNGRTMAQQLAYKKHPESAAKIKEYLARQARAFGLSPAEVQQMKAPVLVRRVKTGTDTGKLRALGRRLNESLTQGLDPKSLEVALGKNYVTKDLVGTLITDMEPDESLADYFGSSRSTAFVNALQRAGIIDEMNVDEFVDGDTGLLNEDGRLRVERVLAARMLPDATILSKMNPKTRANIAKAVPHLLRAEQAGWDVRESMMTAVKADLSFKAGKSRSWRGYLKQTGSEGLEHADAPALQLAKDPTAALIFQVLQERNGPRMMAAGFRDYARRAEHSKEVGGGPMLGFTEEAEKPDQALDNAFGLSPEAKKQIAAAKEAEAAREQSLESEWGISAEDKKRWAKEAAKMERKASGSTSTPPPPNPDAPAEGQAGLFSFHEPDLVKAAKANGGGYIMSTAVSELRHLIPAAAQADKIDGAKLKRRVIDAVLHQAQVDPRMAEEVDGKRPKARQLDALISAMASMHGAKIAKSLARQHRMVIRSTSFSELMGRFQDLALELLKAKTAAGQMGLFDRPAAKPKPQKTPIHRAGGPYIGPRGGKWADPQHKIPWKEEAATAAKSWSEMSNRERFDYLKMEAGKQKSSLVFDGLHYVIKRKDTVTRYNTLEDVRKHLHPLEADKPIPASKIVVKPAPKATPPKVTIKPKPKPTPERKFVTAGEKVGGSRADLYSMTMEEIEKDPLAAQTLITKSKLIGNWKPAWAEADRDNGVSPAAAFAKREIVALVAGKPPNSPELRDFFRKGCKALMDGLARCRTSEDITTFLEEWHDSAKGRKVGDPVRVEDLAHNFDWESQGSFKGGLNYIDWLKAGNEGTLRDHHRAWKDLANSPAFRRDLERTTGITGWRVASGGEVAPLLATSKLERGEYQLFTGVLGKRFANLVNFDVRRRRGQPILGTYYDDKHVTKGRKKFNAEVSAVESAGTWGWLDQAASRSKKPKGPKVEITDKGDKRWIWTRKTGAVGRQGPPVGDSPQSSEEFMAQFNMPYVEFGNWANDAEREWHVTGAHAALHDLAETLGIPASDMSVNGRLSLAFGARGTGGQRAPVAHYEPKKKIINLTKLKGAGSLCHEWGHFLDQAVCLAGNPSSETPDFMSEGTVKGIHPDVTKAMDGVMRAIKYKDETPDEKAARARERSEIGDELAVLRAQASSQKKRLKHESKKERNESGDVIRSSWSVVEDEAYQKYSDTVDRHNALLRRHRHLGGEGSMTAHFAAANELAGGNYYADDRELFARAFESFVEDKLTAQGRRNGYLVEGTRGQFEDDGIPEAGIYMAPGSKDREAVNAAIENFLSVMRAHNQFKKAFS